jgi:hypothetical protein
MSDPIIRIKRLILDGRYRFTEKATLERECDSLSEKDVLESIMNAQRVYKTINSTSPHKKARREKLYVILSFTYDDILVYTKGKIDRETDGSDTFYVLVSSKRSLYN